MGTFDAYDVGDHIAGPTSVIGAEATEIAQGFGGYVHPLFNDPEYARSVGFDAIPLPGELLLFLLGGLAEQAGIFDETTIALIGMDNVRFTKPAYPGDEVTLHMEVVGKDRSPSGHRGRLRFRWLGTDAGGDVLVSAEAELLFRLGG